MSRNDTKPTTNGHGRNAGRSRATTSRPSFATSPATSRRPSRPRAASASRWRSAPACSSSSPRTGSVGARAGSARPCSRSGASRPRTTHGRTPSPRSCAPASAAGCRDRAPPRPGSCSGSARSASARCAGWPAPEPEVVYRTEVRAGDRFEISSRRRRDHGRISGFEGPPLPLPAMKVILRNPRRELDLDGINTVSGLLVRARRRRRSRCS